MGHCLNVFSTLSAATAFIAAVFWLLSSITKVPTVYVPRGSFVVSSNIAKKPQRISPIVLAMRKQSKLSAIGAASAAVAALLTIPASLGFPGPAVCW